MAQAGVTAVHIRPVCEVDRKQLQDIEEECFIQESCSKNIAFVRLRFRRSAAHRTFRFCHSPCFFRRSMPLRTAWMTLRNLPQKTNGAALCLCQPSLMLQVSWSMGRSMLRATVRGPASPLVLLLRLAFIS